MYKISSKTKKIIIVGIIAILIICFLWYNNNQGNETEENFSEIEEVNNTNEIKNENTEKAEEIMVHIAGCVKVEGVLFLHNGDRINDAIEKAGGLNEKADISEINLAFQLEDGMKIYIPSKQEIEEKNRQENVSYNNSLTSKDKTEDYIITSKEDSVESNNQKTSKKVNINTASQTELETLPGIGTSTALKIIDYRSKNGKFESIENIKEVSGIGEAKFNNIKDLITV